MGAVAKRLLVGRLAAAEISFAIFFSLENRWLHRRFFMRTITKRLIAATAAAAPVVRFPCLELDHKRLFLNDNSVTHDFTLSHSDQPSALLLP